MPNGDHLVRMTHTVTGSRRWSERRRSKAHPWFRLRRPCALMASMPPRWSRQAKLLHPALTSDSCVGAVLRPGGALARQKVTYVASGPLSSGRVWPCESGAAHRSALTTLHKTRKAQQSSPKATQCLAVVHGTHSIPQHSESGYCCNLGCVLRGPCVYGSPCPCICFALCTALLYIYGRRWLSGSLSETVAAFLAIRKG